MSAIGDIDIPDDAMKKPEAIIRSMTPKERTSRNPQRQPPPQNRGGQQHDGAGRQPAHPPIRRDEEADEDGYEPVARQEGAFPLPADALNPRKPTII
ncbi:MAG: hypothetical protein ACLUI3_10875 [Christensenellales bacterium]